MGQHEIDNANKHKKSRPANAGRPILKFWAYYL